MAAGTAVGGVAVVGTAVGAGMEAGGMAAVGVTPDRGVVIILIIGAMAAILIGAGAVVTGAAVGAAGAGVTGVAGSMAAGFTAAGFTAAVSRALRIGKLEDFTQGHEGTPVWQVEEKLSFDNGLSWPNALSSAKTSTDLKES